MLKRTLIFCSLICLWLTACAQKKAGKGNSELERVAMHRLLNIPVIEAKIEDKGPFLFILDTGSSHVVFDIDVARELKIKTGPLRNSRGATKGSIFTYAVAPEIEFGIGNLDFETKNVTIAPFLQTSQMIMGTRVHGILGKPIFNRYTIELDHERDEVVFHDPESFHYQGSGGILPITFRQDFAGLPAVSTAFENYEGNPVNIELLVDSGGGALGVSLGSESNFNAIVGPDAKRIPVMGATGLGNDPEMIKNYGFVARSRKLTIGPFDFAGPVVWYSHSIGPFGVVGAEILSRFKVFFDYKDARMILEPNSDYDRPFVDDKAGMFLTATADDIEVILVAQVAPGLPADQAGLRVGDQILSVNGQPASKITLNGVRKLFMKEANYNLKMMRGSDEIEVLLRTEHIL